MMVKIRLLAGIFLTFLSCLVGAETTISDEQLNTVQLDQSTGGLHVTATGNLNVSSNPTSENIAVLGVNTGTINGSILNEGTISGGDTAISLVNDSGQPTGFGPTTLTGGIINSGNILSGNGPAILIGSDANIQGLITNEGIIDSADNIGIHVLDGTIDGVINQPGGVINGASGFAIRVGNGPSDPGGSLGSVTNAGFINGEIDFGAAGGTYDALGGSSGTILNATQLNILSDGSAGATVSTINGDLSFAGSLNIDVNGTVEGLQHGLLQVTDDVDVTGSSANIVVTGEQFIANNDEFVFLTSGGSLSSDLAMASDNSLVLTFGIEQRGNSLVAVISRSDFSLPVDNDLLDKTGFDNWWATAQSLSVVVDEIASGAIDDDSELAGVVNALSALSDPDELARAISSLEPDTDGASVTAVFAVSDLVAEILNKRQSDLRDSESGVASGDPIAINGVWMQFYGRNADQEDRDGIRGFELDMYGLAIGADAPVSDNLTVGVAFSYASSDVDSDNFFKNNSLDIDSYQLSLYGGLNERDYFLDGVVSFARNSYETERNIFPNLQARGDYDGDQFGLRVRGGYPLILESGFHITPRGSAEYSYLSEDSYREKGAGNAGLDVKSQSVEALIVSTGVEIAHPFTTDADTTWIPDFHLDVRYDLIGDKVELDSNFIGVGGSAFVVDGASVERTGIKAGVGLKAFGQSNFSLMTRYDYLYKDDYGSHSFTATVRYNF